MTAHGCLPTREFLYRRHIAFSENCPHGCTDTENLPHLFLECSVARRVWALLAPSASPNRQLTLPCLTAENILYGPPTGCTTPQLQHQWRIISAAKQVIWEASNSRVYKKESANLTALRRRLTLLLRDHAILDFKKDPNKARAAWGVSRWKNIII